MKFPAPLLVPLFFFSCTGTELAVFSNYPEFEEIFAAAGEGKKIAFNYRSLGEGGETLPGIFVLNREDLRTFTGAGLAMDLTEEPFCAGPAYYHQGRVLALFFHSGNGVLCYDPALTGRYLNISEPDMVQEFLGDLNSFITAAYLAAERSLGSCAILPSAEQLLPAFQHTSTLPFQNGELSSGETEKWFADVAHIFADRRWEGLSFENGRPRKTVAFFLPPGRFRNACGPGGEDFPAGPAENAGADWRIIPGPDPESSGGIWMALHRDFFKGKKREEQKRREYIETLLQTP